MPLFRVFCRLVHLPVVRGGRRVPVQPAQVCPAGRGVPHPRVQPGDRLLPSRLLRPLRGTLPIGLMAV